MHEYRDCRRAADLARTLPASPVTADDTQESVQLRAKARRSLIEALAVQHDMPDIKEALTELGRCTADGQPLSFGHQPSASAPGPGPVYEQAPLPRPEGASAAS